MPTPLTPERLVYDFCGAGDPRVSPDGTTILYALGTVDKETKKPSAHLWLCDIDGSNRRQITQSGTANGGGRWSPDGRSIAFVSDRVKAAGIFVLPADGAGEAREVTKHQSGISDLAWSPDGTKLAYVTTYDPENPNEEEPQADAAPKVRVTRRIDYKQDGRGFLGDKRSHIFVVDVASGERTRVSEAAADHGFPHWSPDGAWLAMQKFSHNGMRSQLLLKHLESGDTRTLGTEEGNIGVWEWSPDGTRLIFTGDTRQTFQTDFFVYTMASSETRRITNDLAVLPASGFPGYIGQPSLVWLDERQVLFSAV
ncbi:MAG: hypothetical protein DCC58_07420, partial [Chloroflexi bacterium]